MPELPEVETSRRGISPHTLGKYFKAVLIRQSQLRWPIPAHIATTLIGLRLDSIERRGKYLLLITAQGTLLIHLGMSGNLRITSQDQAAGKHDHIDFIFDDDTVLRFNDQRKFGCILWETGNIDKHPLLASLGPEPLSPAFNSEYLQHRASKRSVPIKTLIMNSRIVVGVGNIYASEALFMANVQPTRAAGSVTQQEHQQIVSSIKTVLQQAIDQGGTTLRDFINAEGKPGYFQQSLSVYGREGQPCLRCSEPVRHIKINQRASYFCDQCQH